MITDIADFCARFYASTFIPILYLHWPSDIQWSFPAVLKEMSTENTALEEKIRFQKNPDFFLTDSFAYFGFVNLNDSPSKMDYVVLGPVFTTTVTQEVLQGFLRECHLTGASAEEMAHVVLNSPRVTFRQLQNMLSLIHLCLNEEKIDTDSHFHTGADAQKQEELSRRYSAYAYGDREGEGHNTWELEQALMDCVSRGDVPGLRLVLQNQGSQAPIKSGTLSPNAIRNSRDLLIVTATLAARAAVAGGLDIEQAYQLSDLYIQECEKTQDVAALDALSYTMLMDFANRVGIRKLPLEGVSKEIFQCLQFIAQRANEPLRVEDVVAFSGRSRSYITKKFKEELGFDISTFITRYKLEEAKALLTYSDIPLSEISTYLCFSSQAYFQNVFKKHVGLTPMQYRRDTAAPFNRFQHP